MTTKLSKLELARRKREAARKKQGYTPTEAEPAEGAKPQITTATANTTTFLPAAEDAPYFREDPPVESAFLQNLNKPFTITPQTYSDLLSLEPHQVGECDPARLNLLCAIGLPGSDDLDIDAYLHRLDLWAAWIAQQTEQHIYQFEQHPEEYNNSEPYWRILTQTTVLQLHFGVRYEPRLLEGNNWDWKDSRDVLLNGPLGPNRTGSCPSLPVLVIALGRRLGYPMHQVHAPSHVFARWSPRNLPASGSADTELPESWQETFNIECHGNGLSTHPDDYYKQWPVIWSPQTIAAEKRRTKPLYLRNLEPAEELAHFLLQRAYVLQAHNCLDEAFLTASAAAKFAPHNPLTQIAAKEAHKEKLQVALKQWGMSEREFFDRLRLRQTGHHMPFPWEPPEASPAPGSASSSQHNAHPVIAIPGGMTSQANPSPIADPIAAAMQAFNPGSQSHTTTPGSSRNPVSQFANVGGMQQDTASPAIPNAIGNQSQKPLSHHEQLQQQIKQIMTGGKSWS